MKKILEVLQYGDYDIRFNTDFDLSKRNKDEEIFMTMVKVARSMMTTLWGGNEHAVLAMIRALAIADLAVSVNRKEMINHLDKDSEMLQKSLAECRKLMEERGIKVQTFMPGVNPKGSKC